MKAIWQMWESIWTPEACNELIKQATEEIEPLDAVIGEYSTKGDASYRRSKIRWIEPQMRDWSFLFDEVGVLMNEANRNAFGFDLSYVPHIQFTEYDGGDEGKYDWHTDLFWLSDSMLDRKLSLCIQLSSPNDYEGGELELDSPELDNPPIEKLKRQGTAICFPSLVRHRVKPITKGKRYSLVAWYEGPKFR